MTDDAPTPLPGDTATVTGEIQPEDPIAALSIAVAQMVKNGGDALNLMRKRIRWLWIVVGIACVAILFSFGTGVAALLASTRATTANTNATTALAAQQRQQATADHDRCQSGNDLRQAIADINQGAVDYIDTILAGFAAAAPPHEPTAQEQAAAAAYAKTRQKQLDKLKDPALIEKNCDALYPIPPAPTP